MAASKDEYDESYMDEDVHEPKQVDLPLPTNTNSKSIIETLNQFYDISIVDRMLVMLPIGHPDRPQLLYVKSHHKDGWVKSHGHFAKGATCGRLYYPHSMQNISNSTLRKLSNNRLLELDISNSFPSIMLWMMETMAIECPHLKRLVRDRSIVMDEIMLDTKCSRTEAKCLLLKIIFLGGTKRSGKDIITHTSSFIESLNAEMTIIVPMLCKTNPELLAWSTERIANKKKDKNPHATCLSFLVADKERLIMNIVTRVLSSHGYIVECAKFDSVLFPAKDLIPQTVIDEIVCTVEKMYSGLRLQFTQEKIDVKPEERITQMTTSPDTTLYIFDERLLFRNRRPLDGIVDMIKTINCNPNLSIGIYTLLSKSYAVKMFNDNFPGVEMKYVIEQQPNKIEISKWFTSTQNIRYVCTHRSNVIMYDRHLVDEFKSPSFFISSLAKPKTSSMSFDEYPNRTIITVDDMKRLDDGRLVLPDLPDSFEYKLEVVIAGMGQGKSEQAMKKILRLRDWLRDTRGIPYDKFRLLIETARVQQAFHMHRIAMKVGLDAKLYCKDDINSNIMVSQYESNFKFENCEPFHAILCDEARSRVGQTVSPTNKFMTKTDAIITRIYQAAYKVYLFDADMEVDNMVRDYYRMIFSPEETLVTKCTHNSMVRNVFQHGSLNTILGHIVLSIRSGLKLAYIFRTKKMMLTMRHALTVIDPTRRIRWFYGATSSVDIEEFFGDVDTYMKVTDDILATSKMTVGTDCQVPVDKIFLFGGFGGSTAMENMQGCGRFRRCYEIHAYLPPCQYADEVCTFNDAMALIKRDETIRAHHYKAIAASGVCFNDGRLQLDPKCRIVTTLAHTIANQRSCYNTKMLNLFRSASYNVQPSTAIQDDDMVDAMKVGIHAWTLAIALDPEKDLYMKAIEYFQSQPIDTPLDGHMFISKNRSKEDTLEDNYKVQVFMIMNRFIREKIPTIPATIFHKLVKNKDVMEQLLMFHATTLSGPSLFRMDTKTLGDESQMSTNATLRRGAIVSFNTCVQLIGFKHANDTDTRISMKIDKPAMDKLQKEINNINTMIGKHKKGITSTKTCPKKLINDMLSTFGRRLVPDKMRTGSGSASNRETVYQLDQCNVLSTSFSELAMHMKSKQVDDNIEQTKKKTKRTHVEIEPTQKKPKTVESWAPQSYVSGSIVEYKGIIYQSKWNINTNDVPIDYADGDNGLSWKRM